MDSRKPTQQLIIQDYKLAYYSLDTALRRKNVSDCEGFNLLVRKGFDVLLAIKDFQCQCCDEKKPFDYKYYTSVLIATKNLMMNPKDQAVRDEYHKLISMCEDGVGSLKGKIAGAMIMFAGVVITASGVLAIQAGIIPLVPACIVGGPTVVISGLTLFGISRTTGPLKATRDFESAVEKQRYREPTESTPLLARAAR